jgi:hypothetical protein
VIVIECVVVCDQCGKRESGFVEMKGAGVTKATFGFVGNELGEVTVRGAKKPWTKFGYPVAGTIVCSDECEAAWTAKRAAEIAAEKAANKKES